MARIVVALGGNALLQQGESPGIEPQRRNTAAAAGPIAELAREHEVVVTHGNGPQVGLLALQSEASTEVPPFPLDVLGAETEGLIGYLIEQELRAHLPEREIVTLLTQVVVDPHDPAFRVPTKPIGPRYPHAEAERLARERGWTLAPAGESVRRVVPSPEPRRILELGAIRLLLEAGALVICAGGGGVPVTISDQGTIRGVEAVIDKDLTSALLAAELKADALLLLTDVDAVYAHWGTPQCSALRQATPAMLRNLRLPAGSMGPKVEAACRFAERTGKPAGIGRLTDAARILRGECGTWVEA